MSEMKKIFGIDLGTTYSTIAHVNETGKPELIRNTDNEPITPSVVYFMGDNKIIVGKDAKAYARMEPDNVIECVKRQMGNEEFVFPHESDEYRAEEISAQILRKLVKDAEQVLGEEIKDVVITCPAYFGMNERKATKKAGELAGLEVHYILNEPTAAAYYYALSKKDLELPKTVLVYDLGGGTFDVTMIEIQQHSIDVICTGGDHPLGGKDWDEKIIAYLVEAFQQEADTTEDLLTDKDTAQELVTRAEEAKKQLSKMEKVPVVINHGGERVKIVLEREKFEELTEDLLERTIMLTLAMLDEAGKKGKARFDELLLVGGSTRMPNVAKRLEEEFSITPISFDPDEAVAKGAAIFGHHFGFKKAMLQQLAEATGKGVEDLQWVDITKLDEKTYKELTEKVDPSHVIPAPKKTDIKDTSVVASKSFGIVVLNSERKELVYNLVLTNTKLPVDTTQRFGTDEENQPAILIRIMENSFSEREVAPEDSEEKKRAELELPSGLPAHSPIDVTFNMNEEGLLEVSALEVTDNRKVTVRLHTDGVMKEEQNEEMKEKTQSIVIV
jgi:molecular chaperone DnaK